MSGYSGTPIAKKLGIKPGHLVATFQAPKDYESYIQPLPDDVTITDQLQPQSDIIHAFVHSMEELIKAYPSLVAAMHKASSLWVAWPKKSSGIITDINRDIIRDYILQEGLVDVKIASYNDVYSSLKCVYRLKDR